MGWWKVQGTEIIIGDLPLDDLGAVIQNVISMYQGEFKRKPTRKEWEALLTASLADGYREDSVTDSEVIKRVRLESEL